VTRLYPSLGNIFGNPDLIEITEKLLLALAGPGPFDRGYAYFMDGRVVAIDSSERRTVATVSGTRMYRVELRHSESQLHGGCNCPASEGIDFCKHCVATALKLRDVHSSGTSGGPGRDNAILEDHLVQQTELAAGGTSAKELKQSITKVTPPRNIFEHRKVVAYFRRLEATLQGIASIADRVPADVLLETALHGMRRLNRALERIDDSGGYRDNAQYDLRTLHIRALTAIGWSPQQRAEHLLEVTLVDQWDQFSGVPHNYAEALGVAGLDAFYAAVERRLDQLPDIKRTAKSEDKWPHRRLTHYLMEQAEQQQDWDAMIALEKRTATTEIDCTRIAKLFLRKKDPAGAADWLTRADATDPDHKRRRMADWAEVHAQMGDWDAAVTAQETVFRQSVEYDAYRQLMEFATQAGQAAAVRETSLACLQKGELEGLWSDEHPAHTLAQIFRDERNWPALRETAVNRIKNPKRLLDAARWLADTAPEEAVHVYERSVNAFIGGKKKRSYQTAARVVIESRPSFEAVGATAFDDCVVRIRSEHCRKLSFIAVLDARVPFPAKRP
jgi:uncharacterized Zn finger protein